MRLRHIGHELHVGDFVHATLPEGAEFSRACFCHDGVLGGIIGNSLFGVSRLIPNACVRVELSDLSALNTGPVSGV